MYINITTVAKLLSIIIVSSLPFLFSLNGEFVFDDFAAVVGNKDVISNSWLDPFDNDFWGTNIKSNLSHKSYRPLTTLSFRFNYYLNHHKLSAIQFKITNLLCHMLCCILVWMAYICIWKRVKMKIEIWSADVPYLATLMFAVHPIHVEAVCGVVGRADILAAATFILSFLFYDLAAKNQRFSNLYLLISIIFAGVSMLFKENGVTVLGACCIYDLVLHLKIIQERQKIDDLRNIYKMIHLDIHCIYRIGCIVISATLLLYARWIIMGSTIPDFKPTDNPTAFSDSLFTKIATYNYIYFLNILLFVWPHWLCYDWSMGCIPLINKSLDFRIVFVLLLYLYAVLFIRMIIRRKNSISSIRLIVIGHCLLIIPFLPAANIIYPVGFVIAERILYISSFGYCFLITVGLERIIVCKAISRKKAIIPFLCIILIYGMKSWQRSFDWQNEYNLFTSALSVCPLNAKVHYNIAKVADSNKQYTDWALSEYTEAIRLYPEYYQAMNNLANLLKNKKQYEEAEYYLRKAIHYKDEFPAAWMNLGIVLANTGRYDEAITAYKTAFRYRRNYADCYYNLGNVYLEMNRSQDAMENWHNAIQLNPKHVSAWTNLLALLDNTGQIESALQIIPKALEELSETPSINFAVANVYGKIDRYKDAEKHFLKAIDLFKTRVQPIHYANLGVLYHRWNKHDLAKSMYKLALKIDPNFHSALKNLRSLERLKKH